MEYLIFVSIVILFFTYLLTEPVELISGAKNMEIYEGVLLSILSIMGTAYIREYTDNSKKKRNDIPSVCWRNLSETSGITVEVI
ncbi:hypothetical protein VNO80_07028 [Phaseolus coccineus]|uniref:Uncharacterized protein n=1 Tax=Phaseolus coccineus TaxID=3886 RepID=A0AAN9NPU0_PHACN